MFFQVRIYAICKGGLKWQKAAEATEATEAKAAKAVVVVAKAEADQRVVVGRAPPANYQAAAETTIPRIGRPR